MYRLIINYYWLHCATVYVSNQTRVSSVPGTHTFNGITFILFPLHSVKLVVMSGYLCIVFHERSALLGWFPERQPHQMMVARFRWPAAAFWQLGRGGDKESASLSKLRYSDRLLYFHPSTPPG